MVCTRPATIYFHFETFHQIPFVCAIPHLTIAHPFFSMTFFFQLHVSISTRELKGWKYILNWFRAPRDKTVYCGWQEMNYLWQHRHFLSHVLTYKSQCDISCQLPHLLVELYAIKTKLYWSRKYPACIRSITSWKTNEDVYSEQVGHRQTHVAQ